MNQLSESYLWKLTCGKSVSDAQQRRGTGWLRSRARKSTPSLIPLYSMAFRNGDAHLEAAERRIAMTRRRIIDVPPIRRSGALSPRSAAVSTGQFSSKRPSTSGHGGGFRSPHGTPQRSASQPALVRRHVIVEDVPIVHTVAPSSRMKPSHSYIQARGGATIIRRSHDDGGSESFWTTREKATTSHLAGRRGQQHGYGQHLQPLALSRNRKLRATISDADLTHGRAAMLASHFPNGAYPPALHHALQMAQLDASVERAASQRQTAGEHVAAKRAEVEQAAADRAAARKAAAEQAEAERAEAERVEAERAAEKRAAWERMEQERVEAEIIATAKARAAAAAERAAAETVAAERAAAQRAAAEKAAAEKAAVERAAAERAAARRAAAEKAAVEKAEADRAAAERRAERLADKAAADKAALAARRAAASERESGGRPLEPRMAMLDPPDADMLTALRGEKPSGGGLMDRLRGGDNPMRPRPTKSLVPVDAPGQLASSPAASGRKTAPAVPGFRRATNTPMLQAARDKATAWAEEEAEAEAREAEARWERLLSTTPQLAQEEDVSLKLTARPEVPSATGLKRAVEEAKKLGGPRPTATVAQLIDAAAEKLESMHNEFRRCARQREARFKAFCECEPIREALSELVEIMCFDEDKSKQSKPRRSAFLDLHLTLLRERFFHRERTPYHARAPYAYQPPPFVEYLTRLEAGEEEPAADARRDEDADDDDDGDDGDEPSGRPPSDLRLFADCMQMWKVLIRRGYVRGGRLELDGIVHCVFELADGHLTHQQKDLLRAFGGDRPTKLQAYVNFVCELVRAATARVTIDEAPSPRAIPVPIASPRARSQVRLKHSWPRPDGSEGEMTRRMGLLISAIARGGDGAVTKATAAKEFRGYCKLVPSSTSGAPTTPRTPRRKAGGKGGAASTEPGPMISYVRLDKAWRMSDGKDYAGLTFRYAVVGRDVVGGKETLLGASRNDAEVMVCFMSTPLAHLVPRSPRAPADSCRTHAHACSFTHRVSIAVRWQGCSITIAMGRYQRRTTSTRSPTGLRPRSPASERWMRGGSRRRSLSRGEGKRG